MSIDTSKVKPGDRVQIAHGDEYRVNEKTKDGLFCGPQHGYVSPWLITAHQPAQGVVCHAPGDKCLGCDHYRGKAPVCEFAVQPAPYTAEWVTEEMFLSALTFDTTGDIDEIVTRDELNFQIQQEHGNPPAPKEETK